MSQELYAMRTARQHITARLRRCMFINTILFTMIIYGFCFSLKKFCKALELRELVVGLLMVT